MIFITITFSINVTAQDFYDAQYLIDLNHSIDSVIGAIWIIGAIIFALLIAMIILVYYTLVLNKRYLNRIDKLIQMRSGTQYEQNWEDTNSFRK